MVRNLWPIWIMFFYISFCKIIKFNHFLYRFITLLHLISSFSLTRSLLVPYVYVFIESIDCILLSSFKAKEILLMFSVKAICLSLLNSCCVFKIDILSLMSFFMIFLTLSMLTLCFCRWFILFSS